MNLPSLIFGPLQPADIAAYLVESGDDNPLHHNAALARSAGFPDALAPGLYLLGLAEQALETWGLRMRTRNLSAQFLAPVPLGTRLELEGRSLVDGAVLRILMKDDSKRLVCIVAAGLAATGETGSGSHR